MTAFIEPPCVDLPDAGVNLFGSDFIRASSDFQIIDPVTVVW